MARKEQRVIITAEGRDKGKTFVLHEMDAEQGEWWFIRLVLALANAGAKMPDEVLFAGAAGFAEMLPTLQNSLMYAIRAIQGLNSKEIKELLDEMRPLITWQPPGVPLPPEQQIFPGVNSQIEEISTWIKLRFEIVQLHAGFSLAVAASTTEQGQSLPEVTPAL